MGKLFLNKTKNQPHSRLMYKKVHPIPHQANFFFVVITLLCNRFAEHGVPHDLSKSYCTNRFQCTSFSNSKSNKTKMPCCVHKDCTWARSYFHTMPNDLPLVSKSNTMPFADDISLKISDHNFENLSKIINEQITNIDGKFRKTNVQYPQIYQFITLQNFSISLTLKCMKWV